MSVSVLPFASNADADSVFQLNFSHPQPGRHRCGRGRCRESLPPRSRPKAPRPVPHAPLAPAGGLLRTDAGPGLRRRPGRHHQDLQATRNLFMGIILDTSVLTREVFSESRAAIHTAVHRRGAGGGATTSELTYVCLTPGTLVGKHNYECVRSGYLETLTKPRSSGSRPIIQYPGSEGSSGI